MKLNVAKRLSESPWPTPWQQEQRRRREDVSAVSFIIELLIIFGPFLGTLVILLFF